MTIDTLPQRLQSCIDRLDDAISRARQDEIMPVADMEREVDALSAAILKASPEDAATLQGLVAGMIARLDMLEAELRAFQSRQKFTEES